MKTKKAKYFISIIIIFLLTGCVSIPEESSPYIGTYIRVEGKMGGKDLTEFFNSIEKKAKIIIDRYNPGYDRVVSVILYSSVEEYHAAGFGRKGNDYSVGTGYNGVVYMVNPYMSKVHNYQTMIQIGIHEYSHVITNSVNNNLPIWISEGIAMLEANQANISNDLRKQANRGELPKYYNISYDDNSVYFYSRSIIEYIINTYSQETLKQLLKNPNIKKVLKISDTEFQEGWGKYLSSI